MKREWFEFVSLSIAASAALLFIGGIYNAMSSPEAMEISTTPKAAATVIDSSFKLPQDSYSIIGTSTMELKRGQRRLQLPDLRRVLVYYGKNNRPDADPSKVVMHFAFIGSKGPSAVTPGKKFYLAYDKKQAPARYTFSPDNAATSLWIEVLPPASPDSKDVVVTVGMQSDQGEVLREPGIHARFPLVEKPQPKAEVVVWEIGKFRVDGTLLARQKARWFGMDCFLDKHGGKEFLSCIGRQRIDFGEGNDIYSVYIRLGEILLWKNERWHPAANEDTVGQPILVAAKIDDRLMTFDLWDAEGKGKTILNLLKSSDAPIPANIIQGLKFVGAKTRSLFVFEYNKERLTLRPNDWIVFIDKQAKVLKSVGDIDEYVDRKAAGFLLTFDTVERRDDRQVFIGTLFNRSRTIMQPVEIAMQPGESATVKPAKPMAQRTTNAAFRQASDDDDDDEDDDDDDDLDDVPIEAGTPRALR